MHLFFILRNIKERWGITHNTDSCCLQQTNSCKPTPVYHSYNHLISFHPEWMLSSVSIHSWQSHNHKRHNIDFWQPWTKPWNTLFCQTTVSSLNNILFPLSDTSLSAICWRGWDYFQDLNVVVCGLWQQFTFGKKKHLNCMRNTNLISIKSIVALISSTCSSCPEIYTVFLLLCDPESISGRFYDTHKKICQFCWLHVLQCQWRITDFPIQNC